MTLPNINIMKNIIFATILGSNLVDGSVPYTSQCDAHKDHYQTAGCCHSTHDPTSYDYIVVGSGAGGAGALYGILNEDPTATVLMLERGDWAPTSTDCGIGYYRSKPGETPKGIERKQAFYLKGGSVDGVPVVEGNTTGGNTANNAGLWGHQTNEKVLINPPFAHTNFDLSKWELAKLRATETIFLSTCASGEGGSLVNPMPKELLRTGPERMRDSEYKVSLALGKAWTVSLVSRTLVNQMQTHPVPLNDSNA